MSECEPLSRPTWVLGVILRKEALFSFRDLCNCFHRFHHASDFLNRLSFTTELTATTPPGITEFPLELIEFISTFLQLVSTFKHVQLHAFHYDKVVRQVFFHYDHFAAELVRLNVLKGHDATECQRFLRKIVETTTHMRRKRPCVCVCVKPCF